MLLACLAGVGAARWLAPRAGDAWPNLAAGLAFAAGAIGWLSSAEVRAVLATSGIGGIGDALAVNPGGWVAGIAFIRGIPYARLPPDPRPIATALAVGTPGIAIAALLGGMIADPWRAAFLGNATIRGRRVPPGRRRLADAEPPQPRRLGGGRRRLAPQPRVGRLRDRPARGHRGDGGRDVAGRRAPSSSRSSASRSRSSWSWACSPASTCGACG